MKLYGFSASPRTWKVRAVAAQLGIPLEYQPLDAFKGENRTPQYLALNPAGRTPTLVDGDFVLWESDAILQYLASKTPNTLWPDDARTRADIMRWQNWQSAHWGSDACVPLTFQNLVKGIFGLGGPDAAVVVEGDGGLQQGGGRPRPASRQARVARGLRPDARGLHRRLVSVLRQRGQAAGCGLQERRPLVRAAVGVAVLGGDRSAAAAGRGGLSRTQNERAALASRPLLVPQPYLL